MKQLIATEKKAMIYRGIARVFINAAAMALTVFLLPGIEVANNRILTYVLLGIAFGLINLLLKPVLQYLTFALLFVTFGLSILLANAVVILIIAWLFPDYFIVTGFLPAIAAGIIVGLADGILESILGLTPPVVDKFKDQRNYK